ncbi:MAG: hypothetical protein JWQ96_1897 [Segetibacter sp.]|nr:hypothetical protein [Segetibacter sp.]
MVQLTTTILKFAQQGDKTGWTYIVIPAEVAQQLVPGNKKSFRVKGLLDNHAIEQTALIPMGEGDFILALNATMRKGIRKPVGAVLNVQLQVDETPISPPAELLECMEDEPEALNFFNQLPKSHQNYFTKWIESAKTDETKAKRIAQSINALSKGLRINELLRMLKAEKANFK